ncbi:hypothetical protein [Kaistia adipata]|uniref:hypothetical protein n=1 Tax=Kaistia adipata TaxID=166954 RepID=UPI000426378C|nr:hypothetical protein [Kaistia adipata]
MAQVAEQTRQQATVRTAATLAASATLVLFFGGKAPLEPAAALAALTPIALTAFVYMTGALAATAVTSLSRRPILGAAALTGLAPFAPLLPPSEEWALYAAFLIFGLLTAGSLRVIVAAFARERLGSLCGAIGLGLIAALAATAGITDGPLMQMVLALAGILACLAVASVVVAAAPAARN